MIRLDCGAFPNQVHSTGRPTTNHAIRIEVSVEFVFSPTAKEEPCEGCEEQQSPDTTDDTADDGTRVTG